MVFTWSRQVIYELIRYNLYMFLLNLFSQEKNKTQNQSISCKKGFTLIEVMVAVSIFAIITTVGIGSLLSVNSAYKTSRAQRTAIDSVNFVLDSMAREIRTGRAYACEFAPGPSADCYTLGAGSSVFSFIDQDGASVTYSLNANKVYRTITTVAGQESDFLTNSEVINITSLVFHMKGAMNGGQDSVQPMVVISLHGEAQYAGKVIPIDLQTSVTQRLLDIPTGTTPGNNLPSSN